MPKKKASRKTVARKVVKKATKTRRASSKKSTFNIRYLSFAVVGLSIFVLTVIVPQKSSVTKSVAGVSIARPLFSKAQVQWSPVANAISYNIYYRKVGEARFTNAVRGLSAQANSYTILYLAKGVRYEYQITALNSGGGEFWYSPVTKIEQIFSM